MDSKINRRRAMQAIVFGALAAEWIAAAASGDMI
jgi:hypothetical protein